MEDKHSGCPVMDDLRKLLDVSPSFFIDVIESLSDGLLITDSDLTILYANQKHEEITGYSREDLVGQTSYKVLVPEAKWPLMQERLRERKKGKIEKYELELIKKDGSRAYVQITATPLKDNAGNICGTIGLTRDISVRKRLEGENDYLHAQLKEGGESIEMIGDSAVIQKMLEQISIVGPTEASVLITGESGTGKELVAQGIHSASLRNQHPLIRVNCAAIPSELFESEFFGHMKGAFTGAIKDRMGRFELADGGTLFLDEVGEIPLSLQSKLLRVLQEGQFEPVGSGETKVINVRVIAATNRNLASEIKKGNFREDLYFRLNVFPINVPPLRERIDDIGALAQYFINRIAKKLGAAEPHFSSSDLERLKEHQWPGNVRELEHVLERAVILAKDGRLGLDGMAINPPVSETMVPPSEGLNYQNTLGLKDLKGLEKKILIKHLEKKNWKIYGPRGAAESLDIKPTTLISKMKKHKIEKPR